MFEPEVERSLCYDTELYPFDSGMCDNCIYKVQDGASWHCTKQNVSCTLARN